jgi:hypothetical protein
VEGGFEAHAIELFVLAQVFAAVLTVLLLGAAQPSPPSLAGGIDGVSSDLLQQISNYRSLPIIFSKSDDNALAMAQAIFINEDFILGQALIAGVFNPSGSCASNCRSRGAENACPKQAKRGDRTSPGNQRHQKRSSGESDASAQQGAHGIAHARLLGCVPGNLPHLFVHMVDRPGGK